MQYSVHLIFLYSIFAYYNTIPCPSTGIISEAIETLCILDQYDEALSIYNHYIHNHPDLNECINTKTGLKLFSHTNESGAYFFQLKKYLTWGGDKEQLHFHTKREFYYKNMATIDSMVQNINPSFISKSDSTTIVEFIINDQDLRINRQDSREERWQKDSINQIGIKNLIEEKKYANYLIKKALSLLLRHCSSDYLEQFKASGLLEFYISQGIITNEEYYSAVEYIDKDIYFSHSASSNTDMIDALDLKRYRVGLLPMRFSPLIHSMKKIQLHPPGEDQVSTSYPSGQISAYLASLCN